jgi:hypothetical protein
LRVIACVLPTTLSARAVEPDFSRLRGAKTDYCINLSCRALEGERFDAHRHKVDLTFKFPTIPNGPVYPGKNIHFSQCKALAADIVE